MKNKKLTLLILLAWVIIALVDSNNTPIGKHCHDCDAHLQYVQIIQSKHHLPSPHEGLHTYHPPLYYLIISFLTPSQDPDDINSFARALSIAFGVIATLIIILILEQFIKHKKHLALIALLTISTPKFVYIFTTFNNDSLATLLNISIIGLCLYLYKTWNNKMSIALFLVSTCSFYTKYTSFYCITSILLTLFGITIFNFLRKNSQIKTYGKRLTAIFVTSFAMFLPWIIFHNYHDTKEFFPTSFEQQENRGDLVQHINSIKSVIHFFPCLLKDEWNSPWALDPPKNNDFFAFSFVTSIIGEWWYSNPKVEYFFILLILHALIGLISAIYLFKSPINIYISFFFICCSYFTHLITISKITIPVQSCFMDYRYIAWNIPVWCIIFGNAFNKDIKEKSFLEVLYILSILIHLCILYSGITDR